MKKVVALMPMKGVSERVPGKNLKLFNGKPLYHWVLNTLLETENILEVHIDTDCPKICLDVESSFKKRVHIINRPNQLKGNYVSMNKIIEHDISTLKNIHFLQTHSTNPLLSKNTLKKAIEMYFNCIEKGEADTLFSVTKVQKRFYSTDCKPLNHDPAMLVTQHLEPMFEENSCFYIFSNKSFQVAKSRIGKNPKMYQMNQQESLDIDTPDDFLMAETIFKHNRNENI
jgi:CMP-N-acetylneuraminic acid synthetase